MVFLELERQTLQQLLPGLDEALSAIPLMEMERSPNPALRIFRELGGPAMLIPRDFGGRGASPLQALRAQRALGARSPSLGVATTMHHLTIATLLEADPDDPAAERELFENVAAKNLYIASGFAEGRPSGSIQTSSLRIAPCDGGYRVSGSKKPCSLSRSMDLLVVSLPAPKELEAGLAAAMIPANTPGVSWRPFWNSPILAGAESDELVLDDVFIPQRALMPLGGSGRSDAVQERGFLWFEMMIAGAYLGMASRLAEMYFARPSSQASSRVQLAVELEGGMASLEAVARVMESGERGNQHFARMVLVRYAVQDAIARATDLAIELLGGLSFIQSPDAAYLLAASRALSLHPPSRASISERMANYLSGAEFVID